MSTRLFVIKTKDATNKLFVEKALDFLGPQKTKGANYLLSRFYDLIKILESGGNLPSIEVTRLLSRGAVSGWLVFPGTPQIEIRFEDSHFLFRENQHSYERIKTNFDDLYPFGSIYDKEGKMVWKVGSPPTSTQQQILETLVEKETNFWGPLDQFPEDPSRFLLSSCPEKILTFLLGLGLAREKRNDFWVFGTDAMVLGILRSQRVVQETIPWLGSPSLGVNITYHEPWEDRTEKFSVIPEGLGFPIYQEKEIFLSVSQVRTQMFMPIQSRHDTIVGKAIPPPGITTSKEEENSSLEVKILVISKEEDKFKTHTIL